MHVRGYGSRPLRHAACTHPGVPGRFPDVLAAMDALTIRMLLGNGRCQVGSDGCSLHRMLLGTGRYQVGCEGCSHCSDAYSKPDATRLVAMDVRPIGCF